MTGWRAAGLAVCKPTGSLAFPVCAALGWAAGGLPEGTQVRTLRSEHSAADGSARDPRRFHRSSTEETASSAHSSLFSPVAWNLDAMVGFTAVVQNKDHARPTLGVSH